MSARTASARRALVGAYAADGLLEWATSVALLVWSYDRTGSALAAGALLIAKQAAPGLLTPAVGRMLDRRGAAAPLAAGLALRAMATATALLVARADLLLPLAALAGTGGMLVRASLRTVAATGASGEERRRTNAAVNTTMGITSLLGPAAGGVAVAASSPLAVALVGAGLGAVAATLAVRFPLTATTADESTPDGALTDGSVVEDASRLADRSAADGHSPAESADPKAERAIPLLGLAGLSTIAALLAIDEPAFLPYVQSALGGTPASYGVILAAWGLGIIAGSLWLGRLGQRSMLAVAGWGAALVAAAYLGLAMAPSVEVAIGIAIVGGIGNGLDWMALVTALQERTPAHRQGRLAADLEAVMAFGPPAGFLLGGLLADAAGPRAPFIAGGVGVLALLAAGVVVLGRRRTPVAAPAPVTQTA